MVVPIKNEFGVASLEQAPQMGRIFETTSWRVETGQRRMVNEDDANCALFAEFGKLLLRDLELMRSQPATRNERRSFDGRIQADECQRSDAPDEREGQCVLFATHIGCPPGDAAVSAHARIDVVVARYDRDLVRRPDVR